jgi:glycosyltransferase involved in cell wall biosynthesis
VPYRNEFVSFVVIAYNEARNIARTVASINSLEDLDSYEIVVVDDGSRDNTAQIVEEIALQDSHVRLIRLGVNYGRGYARSVGIAETKGEIIATVDSDIILPADWLLRARAALCNHDAVGGTAVPDGDAAYLYSRFHLVPRLVGHTTAVTGSNALYRREVFEIVKFNSGLREGEDVALNHETKARGLSFATIPGLLVTHEESKSFIESLRWLFISGKGATRQFVIYREVRQPDVAVAAFAATTVAGIYAAIRGHRTIGVALPSGFVLAASVRHVRSRFETPRSQLNKIVPAVAVDSSLLSAYFAGRFIGLKTLRDSMRK